MKAYLGFVCTSFLFFAVFLIGLFNFLTNYESNRCNMTYMYEYPQLIRVSLPKDVTYTYNKYALYAYGEGKSIYSVREMKFNGVPVLFIPGNRGSPKQVRSLASVSLTKAFRSRTSFILDFFAVDLNEDFSGLYGGFLNEQTKFINICIKKILSMYRRDITYRAITPRSVILIAHSMGGLMAKGLYLEKDFNPEHVQMIITLATPHSPALLSDQLIAAYYDKVNSFWDRFNSSESNVTLISIGGGPRDLLVRSDLTFTSHADLSVLSPIVPGVWLSVDHLCILWCKELVLSLVRLLFDSVDYRSRQLTEDTQLRKNISDYHLLSRSAGKSYHSSIFPESVELFSEDRNPGVWIEMTTNDYTWTKSEGVTNDTTFIIISLATASDSLALHSINHETRDWIFTCLSKTYHNGMKKCKNGINLSSHARIAPTSDKKRKTAVINLTQLRRDRFTHVVVRTLPTKKFVEINFDLFKKKDRIIPGVPNFLFNSVLVPETNNKSIYYSVELPYASKFWQSYELQVTPIECSLTNYGTAAYRVPWSNEGSTTFLKGPKTSIGISLVSPKPHKDSGNPRVDLLLSPQCRYKISLDKSYLLTLGSVVGRCGVLLISHITVCLLLTLAYQVKSLGEKGECPLLHFVMPYVAKPYFVILVTAVAGIIAHGLSSVFSFIPPPDVKIHSGFVGVVIIPLFLHLTSFALTYLFATSALVSVALQGQAFNGVILKFINKYMFGLNWLSEYVLSGVSKVPIVIAAFMITVSSSACGALSLTIGFFFYFFKMISLYEDFWEEIVYWPVKVLKCKFLEMRSGGQGQGRKGLPQFVLPPLTDISFHLTLLLLWAVSVFISVPSLLVWAKNYKYDTHLDPDPHFYNAVIMSACAGILWQMEVPKTRLKWSCPLAYIIVASSVLLMLYGQTSVYRIPYILSGVFILVSLHQFVCGFLPAEEDLDIPDLIPIQDEEPSPSSIDDPDEARRYEHISERVKEIMDRIDRDKERLHQGEDGDDLSIPAENGFEDSSSSSFEHISEQD